MFGGWTLLHCCILQNLVVTCTRDRRLWIWIWMRNFISTASLTEALGQTSCTHACEESLKYAGMTSWQMRQWWTRPNSETSAAESASDVSRCLDTYVVCMNRFLSMKHLIRQSTLVQVTDPMTGRTGSVREPRGRLRHSTWIRRAAGGRCRAPCNCRCWLRHGRRSWCLGRVKTMGQCSTQCTFHWNNRGQ